MQDAVRMKSQPAYQKYSETSIEVVSSALTFSVEGSSTSRCSGNEPAIHPETSLLGEDWESDENLDYLWRNERTFHLQIYLSMETFLN